MSNLMARIYQSPKTVLTSKDLSLIWQISDKESLYNKTAYYVRQKALIRLTRGVFAKSENYDTKELATSLYSPSYISFETVLREAGVVFQHYDSVFIASPYALIRRIDGKSFIFRKIKDKVLFNSSGIINKDNYSIASTERAFLDMIYLFPNYYFDNLRSIDWDKCAEIVKIYNNKQMIKRLAGYKEKYA